MRSAIRMIEPTTVKNAMELRGFETRSVWRGATKR